MPGEDYDRAVGLDNGYAWTYKSCRHCFRISQRWSDTGGRYDDEWSEEEIFEWLEEDHRDVFATLRAGWRYPDGELAPLPFPNSCKTCHIALADEHIWCFECDQKRIARLGREWEAIAHGSLASTNGEMT